MSIDGNWIRKNETKEGPFFEENKEQLREEVKRLFFETRNLFKQIEFYFNIDSKDIAVPDDSLEVKLLEIYTESYKNYCDFDLNDINSMKYSINGFNTIIKNVTPILEQIKYKVNVFYPKPIIEETENKKSL